MGQKDIQQDASSQFQRFPSRYYALDAPVLPHRIPIPPFLKVISVTRQSTLKDPVRGSCLKNSISSCSWISIGRVTSTLDRPCARQWVLQKMLVQRIADGF